MSPPGARGSKKTKKPRSSLEKGREPKRAEPDSTPAARGAGHPGSSQKRKREQRREQLLAVARDVFARRGYARTSVDDIALEAGVARGTFYLYFDDKRDAFSELLDRFARRINEGIVRIRTDDEAPAVDLQVKENILAILRVCLAERSLTKILFTDAVGEPDFERKLGIFYDGIVLLLTESLRDGQAIGLVRDGEPRVLAYLTIGALKELLYQAVTLGLSEESAEALTQQVYTFLTSGYLQVKAPPRKQGRSLGS